MKQTWKKITMGLAAACALAAATVHFAVGHAAEAQKEGVLVPILMYHSIFKDPQRAGMHVLSPDTLEQDLRYLKDHGYTTVSIQQLIDAVYQDAPLPEKPVVLTFDDGYLNNLTYVLPLLEKYDMKATISIVGAYTEQAEREDDENPNYAYLKKQRIAEMAQSGRFEIGVHSYDMHGQQTRKGSAKNKGESTGQYQAVFRADTEQCVALLGGMRGGRQCVCLSVRRHISRIRAGAQRTGVLCVAILPREAELHHKGSGLSVAAGAVQPTERG